MPVEVICHACPFLEPEIVAVPSPWGTTDWEWLGTNGTTLGRFFVAIDVSKWCLFARFFLNFMVFPVNLNVKTFIFSNFTNSWNSNISIRNPGHCTTSSFTFFVHGWQINSHVKLRTTMLAVPPRLEGISQVPLKVDPETNHHGGKKRHQISGL